MVVVRARETVKPLSQRPLDLTYYLFSLMHLICTFTIDVLPLWPTKFQTLPVLGQLYVLLKGVVDGYTAKTNDPFMLATWGLVKRPYEFSHLTVFMWMELFIQTPAFIIAMIGLRKDSSAIYPILLAYSSAALVTTITVTHGTLILPSSDDASLDAHSKFYSVTDSGRWTILGPVIPFLVVPAIMWVDMLIRVTKLVNLGAQAKAQKAVSGKGRKEL